MCPGWCRTTLLPATSRLKEKSKSVWVFFHKILHIHSKFYEWIFNTKEMFGIWWLYSRLSRQMLKPHRTIISYLPCFFSLGHLPLASLIRTRVLLQDATSILRKPVYASIDPQVRILPTAKNIVHLKHIFCSNKAIRIILLVVQSDLQYSIILPSSCI